MVPNSSEVDRTHDYDIFSIITEHFRQDTREFWTRANFYLVAHAGLFSAFYVAYPNFIKEKDFIVTIIPILGLVISVLWYFVLRGAIIFLNKWREQVIRLDKELDRFLCYVEVENTVKQQPFTSPSYITQFLPVIFGVAWGAILCYLIAFLNV